MTSTKFFIQVSDGKTSYTFDTIRDEEELPTSIHYYIGQAHKTYKACVHIEVFVASRTAVLQWIGTDSECSMEGDFDGIVILGKAALKYVANKHSIKNFELDDKAEKYLPKYGKHIAITPRLLLQGQPGWYQRHFGAVPLPQTYAIIQALARRADQIEKYLPITSQLNWGSDDEILKITEKIIPKYTRVILGTSWIIQKAIIDNYDITVEELQYGGGNKKYRWNVYNSYMKMHKSLPVRRLRL